MDNYRNATFLDKIGNVLGTDGVKVDVGLDTQTIILIPVLIAAGVLGGLLLGRVIMKRMKA